MRLFLTGTVLVPDGFVRDAASAVCLFCGISFENKALGRIDVAQLAADVGKAALHGYGSASFGKLGKCAIEHLADCCFEAVQVIGFIDRFLILQPAVIDRNISYNGWRAGGQCFQHNDAFGFLFAQEGEYIGSTVSIE